MSVHAKSAAVLRSEIEERLAERVQGVFRLQTRMDPQRLASGISTVDDCLQGGLPLGAVTEFVGEECSGRTTLALLHLASCIQEGKVAAWIDTDDRLDPESVALGGVDWTRLLWVRCGSDPRPVSEPASPRSVTAGTVASLNHTPVPQGGGGSPHPRSEGNGMPQAIQNLLVAQPRSSALPPRRQNKSIGTPGVPNRPLTAPPKKREEQVATDRLPPRRGEQLGRVATPPPFARPQARPATPVSTNVKPQWSRLDQALRATDLLLQAGGFGLIVLDLGSTPADLALRVPLATWFRYRAACERTQTILLLLSRQPCARSSAALVARTTQGPLEAHNSVLTGVAYCTIPERQRFQPSFKVIPMRKPPHTEPAGQWKGRATWA